MDQTTIMIVDSQPVLCEGLSAYLAELAEFRIVALATSATRVEELVDAYQPEVVVVGSEIDGVNGVDIVNRLQHVEKRPAVVVLASHGDRNAAAAALRQGASGFVLKAAPIQDLVAAIRWARRGEMWISPTLLSTLFADVMPGAPGTQRDDRLAGLTDREIEILELLVEGVGLKEIAPRLHIAINTVRTHTRNIQMKLNVHSNVAAVSVALSGGIRPK